MFDLYRVYEVFALLLQLQLQLLKHL